VHENLKASLISDELLAELDSNERLKSNNSDILELISNLKTYESQFISLNWYRRQDWEVVKQNGAEKNRLFVMLDNILKKCKELEDPDDLIFSSKLALLAFFVGNESGYYPQQFWENIVAISRKMGGYFVGRHFFYKIMGDILEKELAIIQKGGTSVIRGIAFTPLLFLPYERFSMARIYAVRRLIEYISQSANAECKYLFCDISTRKQIQQIDRINNSKDLAATLELFRSYMKNVRISMKYFFEGFGLRSCLLGTDQGVMQEGAETHHNELKREGETLVREIRGVVLRRERDNFDTYFGNDPSSTIKSFDPNEEYLKGWEADPEHYLFARNQGVYSQPEQEKIKHLKVTIIGLGCIGGCIAQVLARIGVQDLTLVDKKVFKPENINRQPYASFWTIGQKKTLVTKSELEKINHKINILTYENDYDIMNCHDITKTGDIIIQCVDDMKSRILIHRIASELNKPVVSMTGQPPYRGFVSTFLPHGPKYEELMGFEREIIELKNDNLNSAMAKELFDKCKIKRAERSVINANQPRKDILDKWYKEFVENYDKPEMNKSWAVTFERTWLMAIAQAHEVVRFAVGGENNLLAVAPKAIIIDLVEPTCLVKVDEPSQDNKWASGGHWDYRNF
jgi:molybdopterin/thiamine biosynthesis adenylyltransferase